MVSANFDIMPISYPSGCYLFYFLSAGSISGRMQKWTSVNTDVSFEIEAVLVKWGFKTNRYRNVKYVQAYVKPCLGVHFLV